MKTAASSLRLLAAVVIAIAALTVYNRHRIDVENIGKILANQSASEVWSGQRITARAVPDMISVARQSADAVGKRDIVLWLGNSQLHTINQFRDGDHLAPYWLAEKSACGGCLLPLGFSLPNANMQELLVVTRMVRSRLAVKLIVLNFVFDTLRHDGLRAEFDQVLTPQLRAELQRGAIGGEIVRIFDTSQTAKNTSGEKGGALQGFAQKHVEDWLVEKLGRIVPLWADRANLRNRVLVDLYETRNWALGIKPSTLRRVIKNSYDRNMAAFDELVATATSSGVPVLVYVAPIRHDLPSPYDLDAYHSWISRLEQMSKDGRFAFLNLERLVPDDKWGEIVKDQVDFMHFQGAGHRLLADAILPEVKRLLAHRAN